MAYIFCYIQVRTIARLDYAINFILIFPLSWKVVILCRCISSLNIKAISMKSFATKCYKFESKICTHLLQSLLPSTASKIFPLSYVMQPLNLADIRERLLPCRSLQSVKLHRVFSRRWCSCRDQTLFETLQKLSRTSISLKPAINFCSTSGQTSQTVNLCNDWCLLYFPCAATKSREWRQIIPGETASEK